MPGALALGVAPRQCRRLQTAEAACDPKVFLVPLVVGFVEVELRLAS